MITNDRENTMDTSADEILTLEEMREMRIWLALLEMSLLNLRRVLFHEQRVKRTGTLQLRCSRGAGRASDDHQ